MEHAPGLGTEDLAQAPTGVEAQNYETSWQQTVAQLAAQVWVDAVPSTARLAGVLQGRALAAAGFHSKAGTQRRRRVGATVRRVSTAARALGRPARALRVGTARVGRGTHSYSSTLVTNKQESKY